MAVELFLEPSAGRNSEQRPYFAAFGYAAATLRSQNIFASLVLDLLSFGRASAQAAGVDKPVSK